MTSTCTTPISCCPRPPGTRSTTSRPPTCTRSCTPSTRRSPRRGRPAPTSIRSPRSAREFSRLAADHLGTRTDVIATPLMHDTPTRRPSPAARCWTGRGECEPIPGVTMPRFVTIERDYAGVAEKMAALGPLIDTLGTTVKGVTVKPDGRWSTCAGPTARSAAGWPTGGPRWPATSTSPRHPRAVGHHQRRGRRRGLEGARAAHRRRAGRPGRGAHGGADQLRRHAGAAASCDHVPGMVGQRDRRTALLAVRGQRRAEQAMAHVDRADALLPRPRLDPRVRRGAAGLSATAELRPASATRGWANRAGRRSPSGTSPRTRNGRSIRSTRTTCTCCGFSAAAR